MINIVAMGAMGSIIVLNDILFLGQVLTLKRIQYLPSERKRHTDEYDSDQLVLFRLWFEFLRILDARLMGTIIGN